MTYFVGRNDVYFHKGHALLMDFRPATPKISKILESGNSCVNTFLILLWKYQKFDFIFFYGDIFLKLVIIFFKRSNIQTKAFPKMT